MPALMISCALPIHTSVPWDRPEMRISSSIVVGCVSSSIWRTNFVPNSGTPYVPVLEPICSGVTPSACVPENSEITSGSVSGRRARVNARQIHQHADHRRVVVAQNVQLHQHVVHRAEVVSAW